jgi:hypothetical protein
MQTKKRGSFEKAVAERAARDPGLASTGTILNKDARETAQATGRYSHEAL